MKFRSEIIWFPLALFAVFLILSWIRQTIIPSITFDEVMEHFNIREPERIKMLCCLGVVAVAIIYVIKVVKCKDDEN